MAKKIKEIIIKVTDKGSLKVTTREVEKLNAAVNKTNAASGKAAKGAKNLDRNMKGAAKMSSNASKNFSKQAQGMQGVLVPAYAELAARVFAVTAAYTALMDAANYSTLLKGQQAYAIQTGKSLSSITKTIQTASKHMLGYKEAATSAALATTSGLTTKQIERMTSAALGASVALGRDMSDSMDRLTRGIVKAEPEILDELGIIIRLDTVYKEFADDIGVTTASLSEFEKMTARTNAILGQAETKFGDIGAATDPNQYAVLGATILDIARSASSLLSDVFSPIAKFLADSETLLAALMAMITRSVLATALPAMKGFGAAIEKIPRSLADTAGKIAKFGEDLKTKIEAKKLKLIDAKNLEKEFKKTIKTFAKQSPKVAEAIAKGFKGPKFIKAISRAMGISIRHATARIKQGDFDFGGMLKGMDQKGVKDVANQFDRLVQATKTAGKEMKSITALSMASWLTDLGTRTALVGEKFMGMGASLISFNANLYNIVTSGGGAVKALRHLGNSMKSSMESAFGFQYAIDKSAFKLGKLSTWIKKGNVQGKKSAMVTWNMAANSKVFGSALGKLGTVLAVVTKGITGLATIAISGLLSGMNMLVGLISAFSMAGWALDWLGVGTAINEAKDAMDGSITSLNKLAKEASVFKVFSAGYAGMADEADRMLNLNERLLDELTKISSMDVRKAMKGWTSGVYEAIVTAFGSGLSDVLGDATAEAIASSLATGSPIGEDTLRKLQKILSAGGDDNLQGIYGDILNGRKLSEDKVSDLSNALDNYVEILNPKEGLSAVRRISEGLSTSSGMYTADLKKAKVALDELSSSSDEFSKQQRDLGRDLIKNTPFTKYAESYEANIKKLLKATKTQRLAFIESKGALDPLGKRVSSPIGKGRSMGSDIKRAILLNKDAKQMRRYLDLVKQSEAAKSSFDKASRKGDVAGVESAQRTAKSIKIEIEKLSTTIYDKLVGKFGSVEGVIQKLLLGDMDPTETEKFFREKQQRIEALVASKAKLDKIGVSTTSTYLVSIERELLDIKETEINITLKILELDEEKNKRTIVANKRELQALRVKKEALNRNTLAIKEYNAEANGGTVTFSQKWDAIMKDMDEIDNFKSMAEFEAVEVQRAHELSTAFSGIASSLNPLIEEANKTASALDLINSELGKGSEEANLYVSAWMKINTEVGKFNTEMRGLQFAETESFLKAYTKFSLATRGVKPDSVEHKQTVQRGDFAALARVEERKYKSDNPLATEAQIRSHMKIMTDTHTQVLNQTKIRFQLERKIAKLTNINTRKKSISEERANLKLQAANWKESSTLLELRQATAKIERDYANEGLEIKKKELRLDEIMLAYSKLEFELLEAKREEAIAAFDNIASAYQGVASTISTGVGDAISSAIMGNEEDQDWTQIIAQSLADASGSIISSMVNEQFTSRDGLMAKLFDDGPLKDAIFGKEDPSVQLGKDMNSLAKMAEGRGLKVRLVGGSSSTTTDTDSNTVPNSSSKGFSILDTITELFESGKNAVNEFFEGVSSSATPVTDLFNNISDTPRTGDWGTGDVQSNKSATAKDPIVTGQPALQYIEDSISITKPLEDAVKSFKDFFSDDLKSSIEKTLSTPVNLSSKEFINQSVASLDDNWSPEKMTRYIETLEQDQIDKITAQGRRTDFRKNQFIIKDAHRSGTTGITGTKTNKTLPGFQHPESVQAAKNWSTLEAFKNNKPILGAQQSLPFTGEGIPRSSTVESGGAGFFDWLKKRFMFILPNDNIMSEDLEQSMLQEEMSIAGFDSVVEAVNEETILDKNMSKIIDGQAMSVKVLNAEELKQPSGTAYTGDWGSGEFSGGTASGFSFTKDTAQSRMLAEQGWDAEFENSQNTIASITNLEGNLGATLNQGFSDLINNNDFNFGRLAVSFLQNVANSAISGAATGISNAIVTNLMTGANGGVAPGGFKAFANGGVVKKPTFGLIGEGKFNEAVVPLPDGKSIPISGKMSGDTENNINITINMGTESGDDSSTDKQSQDGVAQLAGNITKLVQQELVEQKRPGGLLYQ